MALPLIVGGAMMLGGALTGRSAAKKAANAAKGLERNYLKEMQGAMDAQEAIQSRLIGLEGIYRPQWQDLEGQMLQRMIGASRIAQEESAKGQGQRAMGTVRDLSPAYAALGEEAMANYRRMLGPDSLNLLTQLRARAMEGMAKSGSISKEEEDQIKQATRAAMQARGMQMGNQSAAMEALAFYTQKQQREENARVAAERAYQLTQNEPATAWQMYSPGIEQLVRQGADPRYLTALAQQMQQTSGPQVFQPESNYNAAIYGANQQNELNSRLAGAQVRAGIGAGLMSAGGAIAGSAFGNPNFKANFG